MYDLRSCIGVRPHVAPLTRRTTASLRSEPPGLAPGIHAWYIIAGVLLVAMALAGTLLKRLPLTTSLLYLLVGVALGPWGAGLIRLDPVRSRRRCSSG